MMQVTVTVTENANPKKKPDSSSLGFGQYFSDHMFMMEYDRTNGWHDARIVPFGPLSLHPAATVLHYGAGIFEGLKVYRRPDGRVQLFRPMDNIRRMNDSAERLSLPQIPEDMAREALFTFAAHERDWVPSAPGTSLYLRPFMYGDDDTLGVHSTRHATFVIIASPAGSYYKEGIGPVRIMIEDGDVRAVRGGTGYAKCGGNYAAAARAGEKAEEKGFSQVLWLDGVERRYIEEVGSMNVMFRLGDTFVTPALTGSILPGVTRRSCITLLRDNGYTVEERLFSVEELAAGLEDGTLREAFGCGTAAVISPIGHMAYRGKEYMVGNGSTGPATAWLYRTLTGIQWGTAPDPYGWTVVL